MQLIDWQYTLIPTNYSIKLKGDFYKFVNIFQWKFWLQLNNCNWLIFNYCVQSWPCRFHTRSRSIGVTFERLCLENAKTQCHGLSHVLCCPDRTCTEPTFPVVCSAKVRIHCRLAGVAFSGGYAPPVVQKSCILFQIRNCRHNIPLQPVSFWSGLRACRVVLEGCQFLVGCHRICFTRLLGRNTTWVAFLGQH